MDNRNKEKVSEGGQRREMMKEKKNYNKEEKI